MGGHCSYAMIDPLIWKLFRIFQLNNKYLIFESIFKKLTSKWLRATL